MASFTETVGNFISVPAIKAEIQLLEEKLGHLKQLLGMAEPTKRVRKPGRPAKAKASGKGKKTKGKRSASKALILDFLKSRGEAGATVAEIATHAKKPKTSINAFLFTTGKKYGVKGMGNRSGVYYLSK